MANSFPIEITKYGFKWGPVDVVRMFDDAKFGVCLEIRTDKEVLQVRVTPKGLIRNCKAKPGGNTFGRRKD